MASSQHLSVLVTHPQSRLATYFGEQALRSLREIADVRLNTSDEDLAGPSLIDAARDCAVMIAYRQTPVDAAVLALLPSLPPQQPEPPQHPPRAPPADGSIPLASWGDNET